MSVMHDRLLAIFREIFFNDEMQISDDMGAKDVVDWDSLAQVKLVIAIEEEFEVKFTTQEVAEMRCIGDLKAALQRRNIPG